jgi:hypothetical protein
MTITTVEKESFMDYLESGLSVVSKTVVSMNIIILIGKTIGEKFFKNDNSSKKTINKVSIVLTIICISVFLLQLLYFMNSNLENVNLNSYVIESIFWWFIMFAVLLVFVPSDQMDLSGGSSENVLGSVSSAVSGTMDVAKNSVSDSGNPISYGNANKVENSSASSSASSSATGATNAASSLATGIKSAATGLYTGVSDVASNYSNNDADFKYDDGKPGNFSQII